MRLGKWNCNLTKGSKVAEVYGKEKITERHRHRFEFNNQYKTEVFELARYINKEAEIIPENSILKPPSAELRPDQKDSDSLPDYDVLDKVLFEYIENRKGPKELLKMGFEETVINRVLRMVNSSEYKRYQTPPVLRISHKAFGMGRRMPIVAKYLL